MLTRCFIAVDLSREALNEIREIQKIIGKRFLFSGKFTEPENLHLTLKFLGELDDTTLEKVKERLAQISFSEIKVSLGGVGVFSKNDPKIIWITLHGVYELQKAIDESLNDLFEKEQRFMSHITLARIKHIAEKKELGKYVKHLKGHCSFLVDRFYLKKSELKPEGPVYTDIAEYTLMKNRNTIS